MCWTSDDLRGKRSFEVTEKGIPVVRKSLAMIAAATLMASPVAAQSQNRQCDNRGGSRDDDCAATLGGTPTAALIAALVIWLLTILVATNNGNGPRQTSP